MLSFKVVPLAAGFFLLSVGFVGFDGLDGFVGFDGSLGFVGFDGLLGFVG